MLNNKESFVAKSNILRVAFVVLVFILSCTIYFAYQNFSKSIILGHSQSDNVVLQSHYQIQLDRAKTILTSKGINVQNLTNKQITEYKIPLNISLDLPSAVEAKISETEALDKQQKVIDNISKVADIKVTDRFGYLLNAISVEAKLTDIDNIANVEHVNDVNVSQVFKKTDIDANELGKATDVWEDVDNPWVVDDSGNKQTNPNLKSELSGQCAVIAVLDSGVDYEHSDLVLSDQSAESIENTDCGLNSQKVMQLMNDTQIHHGGYYTTKVPYGYNYADSKENDIKDLGRTGTQFHGMHVSGIAAANGSAAKGYADNVSSVDGAAPNAQILAMKVFGDDYGYARTQPVVHAIEDSVKLKATVINMSLGSTDGIESNDLQAIALRAAAQAGVLPVISAGNEGTLHLQENVNPWYRGKIGTPAITQSALTVASQKKRTITSYKNYIQMSNDGDAESFQTSFRLNNSAAAKLDADAQKSFNFNVMLMPMGYTHRPHDDSNPEDAIRAQGGQWGNPDNPYYQDMFNYYIGYGFNDEKDELQTYLNSLCDTDNNFDTFDECINDKVSDTALMVAYHSNILQNDNMQQLVDFTKNIGFKALVIRTFDSSTAISSFNFSAALKDTELPVIIIQYNAAKKMVCVDDTRKTISPEFPDNVCDTSKNNQSFKIYNEKYKRVNFGLSGNRNGETYPGSISSFSSSGSTPYLEIKPDLAAPGEQIYSTVNDNQYATMSGTSMAAPFASGAVALLSNELKKHKDYSSHPELLAKDLKVILQNTAQPILNQREDSVDICNAACYISPRRQGSGAIDLNAAFKTPLMIENVQNGDGLFPLKELSKDQNGVAQVDFKAKITNLSNQNIQYKFTRFSGKFNGTTQTASDSENSQYKGVMCDTSLQNNKTEDFLAGQFAYYFTDNLCPITGDNEAEVTSDTPDLNLSAHESAVVTFTLRVKINSFAYIGRNYEAKEAAKYQSIVEGFVGYEPVDQTLGLPTVSAPFMGYYGDLSKSYNALRCPDIAGCEMVDTESDTNLNNYHTISFVNKTGNNISDTVRFSPSSSLGQKNKPSVSLRAVAVRPIERAHTQIVNVQTGKIVRTLADVPSITIGKTVRLPYWDGTVWDDSTGSYQFVGDGEAYDYRVTLDAIGFPNPQIINMHILIDKQPPTFSNVSLYRNLADSGNIYIKGQLSDNNSLYKYLKCDTTEEDLITNGLPACSGSFLGYSYQTLKLTNLYNNASQFLYVIDSDPNSNTISFDMPISLTTKDGSEVLNKGLNHFKIEAIDLADNIASQNIPFNDDLQSLTLLNLKLTDTLNPAPTIIEDNNFSIKGYYGASDNLYYSDNGANFVKVDLNDDDSLDEEYGIASLGQGGWFNITLPLNNNVYHNITFATVQNPDESQILGYAAFTYHSGDVHANVDLSNLNTQTNGTNYSSLAPTSDFSIALHTWFTNADDVQITNRLTNSDAFFTESQAFTDADRNRGRKDLTTAVPLKPGTNIITVSATKYFANSYTTQVDNYYLLVQVSQKNAIMWQSVVPENYVILSKSNMYTKYFSELTQDYYAEGTITKTDIEPNSFVITDKDEDDNTITHNVNIKEDYSFSQKLHVSLSEDNVYDYRYKNLSGEIVTGQFGIYYVGNSLQPEIRVNEIGQNYTEKADKSGWDVTVDADTQDEINVAGTISALSSMQYSVYMNNDLALSVIDADPSVSLDKPWCWDEQTLTPCEVEPWDYQDKMRTVQFSKTYQIPDENSFDIRISVQSDMDSYIDPYDKTITVHIIHSLSTQRYEYQKYKGSEFKSTTSADFDADESSPGSSVNASSVDESHNFAPNVTLTLSENERANCRPIVNQLLTDDEKSTANSHIPGIDIDAEHFPDPVFRQYLKSLIPTSWGNHIRYKTADNQWRYNNNYPSSSTLFAITDMSIINFNITSFKGIEYFPCLKKLDITGNKNVRSITEFKSLPLLTELHVVNTPISSLDLSDEPKVAEREPTYSAGNIQSTDLVFSTSLKYLYLSANNNLKAVNLDNLVNLDIFSAVGDQHNEKLLGFNSIDFSNNKKLRGIWLYYSKVNSIKFANDGGYDRLVVLSIQNNALLSTVENINLLHNVEKLFIYSDPLIESLDLSDYTHLTGLRAQGCLKLHSLQLPAQSTSLDTLLVSETSLHSESDISNFDLIKDNLEVLEWYSSQLQNIDLTGFSKLKSLFLSNNKLTSIEGLNTLSNLAQLQLSHNKFSSFVTTGLESLENLNLADNKLESLDLIDCHKLRNINGAHNSLKKINSRDINSLSYVVFDNQTLPPLNLSKSGNVYYIDVSEFADNNKESVYFDNSWRYNTDQNKVYYLGDGIPNEIIYGLKVNATDNSSFITALIKVNLPTQPPAKCLVPGKTNLNADDANCKADPVKCNANQVLQNGKCVNKPAKPAAPSKPKPVAPSKPKPTVPSKPAPTNTNSTATTSASANVKVTKVVIADIKTNALSVGKKLQLNVSVLPLNATVKGVVYVSSDTKKATVSASGKVSAKKSGKVTITVKSKNNQNVKAKITLYLIDKKVLKKTQIAKQIKIKKIKVGKKSLTITWSRQKGKYQVDKFTVQYRVLGKAKWQSKTVKSSSAKVVLKKLKAKLKYQIRVVSIKKLKAGTKSYKTTTYGITKTSPKVK